MIEIETNTKTEVSVNPSSIIIRYGWGNEILKTWFLTKTKKAMVPEGSRLLMVFGCEETDGPISSFKTYPEVGDVVSDVDGEHIKIKTVDWV